MQQADRIAERKQVAGPNSDINVTPLVDVCLVLLILFMVIPPMLDEDIILPKARHHKSTPKEDDKKVTLVLQRDKKLVMGHDAIVRDELIPVSEKKYQGRADKSLYLKADESLHWGEVMKVMDLTRKGGVEEIELVTEDYPVE